MGRLMPNLRGEVWLERKRKELVWWVSWVVAKSSNDPPRSNCQLIPRVLTLKVPLTSSSSSHLVCRAKRGLLGRVPPQKMLTGTCCAREAKEGRIDVFPMRRKRRRRSKRSRRRRPGLAPGGAAMHREGT